MTSKLTEPEIVEALRKRFAAPEYALFTQVRSRTGYGGDIRTADAIAMCLYPSRGLEIHGVEIKVSRSDWLRELKAPDKAEEIARHCDRWWVAVGDESIVSPGELPATWGLLVPRGKGLVAKVEGPITERGPVARAFLAAILRNASDAATNMIHRDSVHEEIEKARMEGRARGAERATEELKNLKDRVEAFESASGVSIQEAWSAGELGEAVRLVMGGGVEHRRRQLEGLRDTARRILDGLDRVLAPTGDGQ